MDQPMQKLGITELCQHSGVPVSTIKYYIKMGLLPKPVKTGKTRGYYHPNHLNRLVLIKKLQKEENMPLKKIREITRLIDDEKGRDPDNSSSTWLNRSLIIEKAVGLFRHKGYEKTTIADIVGAAQIGRDTFYKCFENKKALFLECIRTVVNDENKIIYDFDITDDNDWLKSYLLMSKTNLKRYFVWKDMINILRALATSNPDEFADALKESIQAKVDFFEKHIGKGIRSGMFREVNVTVLAVMFTALQDLGSEYFSMHKPGAIDQKVFDDVNDIILNGILRK